MLLSLSLWMKCVEYVSTFACITWFSNTHVVQLWWEVKMSSAPVAYLLQYVCFGFISVVIFFGFVSLLLSFFVYIRCSFWRTNKIIDFETPFTNQMCKHISYRIVRKWKMNRRMHSLKNNLDVLSFASHRSVTVHWYLSLIFGMLLCEHSYMSFPHIFLHKLFGCSH